MPQKHTEYVNAGLVTARDAVDLQDGELVQAEEGYYKPKDHTLYPFPGRTTFNAVVLTSPRGIGFYQVEGSTADYIIAFADGKLYYATLGETGSFTLFDSPGGSGTHFELIQLDNKAIMIGPAFPRVTDAPPTAGHTLPLGYNDVPFPPTLVQNVGTGTFELAKGGNYYYWTTEYNDVLNIESGNSGGLVGANSIYVGTLADSVTVTKPVTTNSTATYWRVYRSALVGSAAFTLPGEEARNNPFPFGYLIATVAIGTTTYVDTGSTPLVTPYPTLEIEAEGAPPLSFNLNGPAPLCNTGDIFENCIVVNDLNNRTQIRYSFYDNLGAWPSVYFINNETAQQDEVLLIRRIRSSLLVLMRGQIMRVNTLPREFDPQFARGRVYDILTSNVGVVGQGAADLVSFDGGPPVLVFMDRSGPYYTDGMSVEALENDIDWTSLIATSYWSNTVVRDYPEKQLLAIFYTPVGSTTNTKAMLLHYHGSHRKGGLKVTGPITVNCMDAVYINSTELTTGPALFTLATTGTVSLEGRAAAPLPIKVKSRQHVIDGWPTVACGFERFFVRHRSGSGTGKLKIYTQAPDAAEVASVSGSFTPTFAGFSQIDKSLRGENWSIYLEAAAGINHWQAELGDEHAR